MMKRINRYRPFKADFGCWYIWDTETNRPHTISPYHCFTTRFQARRICRYMNESEGQL